MDPTTYIITLQNIQATITQNIAAVRAKIDAWSAEALAKGVDQSVIVQMVLVPFDAWNRTVTTLRDDTIPQEIMRVQAGGAPGDASAFVAPGFSLPPVPTATVTTSLAPTLDATDPAADAPLVGSGDSAPVASGDDLTTPVTFLPSVAPAPVVATALASDIPAAPAVQVSPADAPTLPQAMPDVLKLLLVVVAALGIAHYAKKKGGL